MVLQLTGGVEALASARRTETAHGDEPVIVSLVKGRTQDIVVARLRRIFGEMHLGQTLEPGAAACVLLLTSADLVVRFSVLALYPFKFARMCRAWFADTW